LLPIKIKFVSWYFKVFWNKRTYDSNLVLTRVIGILNNNPTIMQKSFHSCQPLLVLLVHVIIFYNDVYAPFNLTFVNPKQTFTSSSNTLGSFWHDMTKTKANKWACQLKDEKHGYVAQKWHLKVHNLTIAIFLWFWQLSNHKSYNYPPCF
jgi:hypothetical protein